MNNKNSKRRSRSVATISLFTATIASFSPTYSEASDLFTFRSLGSGAELRSSILTSAADPVATPTPDSKTGEAKCGEGRCG